MTLRSDLEGCSETVQEFELAARQKYFEALELMVSEHGGGGIYLMGYVAEMLLKNAFFRFTGALPADGVERRLAPARKWAEGQSLGVDPESYHSLRFWAWLLIKRREFSGAPLPVAVEGQLRRCADRLYENWWVEMRYRQDRSSTRQAETVLADVNWLYDHYAVLWR